MANYTGGDDPNLQWALADELSAIILGVSIYDANRFAGVMTLRQETLDLLATNPTGLYLARLNRMLLEDAFPGDLLSMSLSLWVFKDNLFDKAAFEQYDSAPLDQDFNAYWKRLPEELEPWEWDGLYPDAANDRVLASTPIYQPGPLGAYYLATSSPLYQAGNRGSRPVTDAGLYHYTTRLDQTKDGAQSGNAMIGRHYVATTSSSTNRPKDSETPIADGVPDYVEDANGNNDADDVSNALETSPTLAQTATGIADSINVVYDDIDLDGDGMVGRIEKAFNPLNPQTLVSDNPLVFTTVTPQTYPEDAAFTLPINYASLNSMRSLEFDVDGTPVQVYLVADNGDGKSRVRFNTTFVSPGERFVSARFNSSLVSSTPRSAVLSAPGPLLRFPINNIMRFEPSLCEYTEDGGWLYAELAVPSGTDAAYTISLYDPLAGPSDPPFRTISGNTTTGFIQEYWDNQSGGHYSGESANAVFEVTPSGGTQQSRTTTLSLTPSQTALGDNFTFAYGHTGEQSAQADQYRHTCMQFGAVDILLEGVARHALQGPNYSSTFNSVSDLYGAGGYDGLISEANWQSEIDTLIADLQRMTTRNFFFYGHGLPDYLQGALTHWEGTNAVREAPYFQLGMWDVAAALGNVLQDTSGVLWWTRRHPYRVVVLDACLTASTAHWCTAFGIGPTYYNDGTWRAPVQGFAGFSTYAYGPGFASDWVDYGETYTFVFGSWMNSQTLAWCLRRAQHEYPLGANDHSIRLTIPYGGGLPKYEWRFGRPFRLIRGAKLEVWGLQTITRSGWVP